MPSMLRLRRILPPTCTSIGLGFFLLSAIIPSPLPAMDRRTGLSPDGLPDPPPDGPTHRIPRETRLHYEFLIYPCQSARSALRRPEAAQRIRAITRKRPES